MSSFHLDPRLARDTIELETLTLCQVRLMNNSAWPWLVLVPQRENASQLTDLTTTDQAQLLKEIDIAARIILDQHPQCRTNIGLLGNIVSQLHIHVVGRHEKDPAWPGPVWGNPAGEPYKESELIKVRTRLRNAIKKAA